MAKSAKPSTPRAVPSDAAVRKRIEEARAHCASRGAQLTEMRALVLELLLRHDGAAKAYDLLAELQANSPGVAPMTVYRALDFLVEQDLVHKVESNSSFVVCQHEHHPHHDPVFMVCRRCGSTTECDDPQMSKFLSRALSASGFHAQGVEIKGECGNCSDRQTEH